MPYVFKGCVHYITSSKSIDILPGLYVNKCVCMHSCAYTHTHTYRNTTLTDTHQQRHQLTKQGNTGTAEVEWKRLTYTQNTTEKNTWNFQSHWKAWDFESENPGMNSVSPFATCLCD